MTPARRTGSALVLAGSDVAKAIKKATSSPSDSEGMDAAYRKAFQLAEDTELRAAIAFDHVADLRSADAVLALRRCDDYLRDLVPDRIDFRLLRAEILSSVGRHTEARAEAAAILRAVDGDRGVLTSDERARLSRVEAYAIADEGHAERIEDLLDQAAEEWRSSGNRTGLAAVDRDRRAVRAYRGDVDAAVPARADASDTVPARLTRAHEYRNRQRYEDALEVVDGILADERLDPALRAPVLYERFQLLRLARQNTVAIEMMPELRRAVEAAEDRELVNLVTVLTGDDLPIYPGLARLDRKLIHVRRLLDLKRFAEAERLLQLIRPKSSTHQDAAAWHLVAGELALARHVEDPTTPLTAAADLDTAIDLAAPNALTEVRIQALRSAGETAFRSGMADRAIGLWAEAYAAEEGIAFRQRTPVVRTAILSSAATGHDSMITAAATMKDRHGPAATASVVVAMENARGVTLLDSMEPIADGVRRLPSPLDLDACRQWLDRVVAELPRSRAVLMSHVTPDRIHYAVVGRDLVEHVSFRVRRKSLVDAVDRHRGCWSSPQVLESSIVSGEFDQSLSDVAMLTGIHDVLRVLPARVRRIAFVAARELADIPFSGVAIPDTAERVVHRFAWSDLQSLSVARPLRIRAGRQRGDRTLLVRPPPGKLTPATRRAHSIMDDERATVEHLRAVLGGRNHQVLRIDTHGWHDEKDPENGSWLQLAPDGQAGRLTPNGLATIDLSGCGTAQFGACESGLVRHGGRDERIGFTSTAMLAGAAAVVAARWKAHDVTTAALLDRFEHGLRRFPRDVALQRAQIDVFERARGMPADVSFHKDPARWACWTLFGDPGVQTRAGFVRRLLRRVPDLWRRVP